jgi:hypothetical protein
MKETSCVEDTPEKPNGEILKTTRKYFDEDLFRKTLEEYKKTLVFRDKAIVSKNDKLETNLVLQVEKIVNAIIIVYRYYIFEDYDDLKQHALNACYTNFLKFDPTKGTAFNYYSIIAKISLLNYTDRKQKHRNHQNIDECLDLECKEDLNYDLCFDNLESTLFGIVDTNYLGSKRKRYIQIVSIIMDYLRKTKKFVGKSDLYAWGRSYGIKNNMIRDFINDMSKYNNDIFEGIK